MYLEVTDVTHSPNLQATIDSVAATVTKFSGYVMTIVTPPVSSAGAKTLVITVGGQSATNTVNYADSVTVTGVSPATGSVAARNTLTITGGDRSLNAHSGAP
jgi:hypothetical protein